MDDISLAQPHQQDTTASEFYFRCLHMYLAGSQELLAVSDIRQNPSLEKERACDLYFGVISP